MAEESGRLLYLLKTLAFKRGHFVLSSGRESSYYIDCRLVTLHPEGAYLVGKVLFDFLRDTPVRAIGGLTLGADPIATAVAAVSHLEGHPISAFIVRREAKAHGRGRLIEGPLSQGMPVAVVDDVCTTGDSLLAAIRAVEEAGCSVAKVLCLVDREEGGREALAAAGYQLTALFSLADLQT